MYAAEAAKHRQLLQDIDDARALGSPLLRVTLGERPPKGKATTVIHYAARQAVEWAAGRRIQLSLENNAKAPGERLAGIHETLQDFDCRYLGTNIDFANYVANDQDPLQAIRTLTRWINYVHAKDARKTPEGWKSTSLGDGTLPLQEIVAALDATQRRFAFCFEFPGDTDPEGAIRKSLEFMARLDA
jgi:sugar phosphate isomerase/epimerase